MVDAVGAEARGFLSQAAIPEGDTDVLLITVDGKGAPDHLQRREREAQAAPSEGAVNK
jgi:hypothetical protein